MATNLSTSSNFGKAHVDAWIQSKLLDIGTVKTRFRDYATKKPLPQGQGTVVRFLRYDRLNVPLAPLSEGVAPSDDSLSINYIEATAKQYGQVVTISDVLQLTINHPVLQQAVSLVGDSMVRTDDRIIQEALISGTNVFYGASRASRDLLTTADVPDTTLLRKIMAKLELTDGVAGAAPYFNGGFFAGVFHKKHTLDMMTDATWKDMAIRQSKEDLEKGIVNRWAGAEWKASNFMHELENAGATAALATNGGTITAGGAGSTLVAGTDQVVVTRQHKKRGFEEVISQRIGIAVTAGQTVTVTIGSGGTTTNYVYNVYFSQATTSTTCRLVTAGTRVEAGTAVVISAYQATGTVAPTAPGTVGSGGVTAGFKAYTSYVFGADSFGVVDLEGAKLDAGVTPAERSISDPLMQLRKVGAKFFNCALILNDLWVARLEAPSTF